MHRINKGILLKTLWDHSLLGIGVVAENGTFLDVNPAYCNMLEYTKDELLEKRFQDITVPIDSHYDELAASKVAAGQSSEYTMSKAYITKTGKLLHVKLKVVPLKDEDGKFEFFLAQIAPSIREAFDLTADEVVTAVKSKATGFKAIWTENKVVVTALVIPFLAWATKAFFEFYHLLRSMGVSPIE